MNKDTIELLATTLKRGDMSVLEKIYKENRTPFVKYAASFNLPEEDIVDVYQDAIIALRDNVTNGTIQQLDCSLRTYLFSIGKFMMYKRYKDQAKRNMLPTPDTPEVAFYSIAGDYDPKDALQQKIDVHFDTLGEKCQELLKLFYYDGLTLKEIQAYFNYDNYNVVKSQKSRCIKTLRDLIQKNQNNG